MRNGGPAGQGKSGPGGRGANPRAGRYQDSPGAPDLLPWPEEGDGSMGGQKKKDEAEGVETICRNRRALHEYEILDVLECGLVLTGTEVKSLRDGHAMLEDAYAKIEDGELWL